jgi:hypothetical protein
MEQMATPESILMTAHTLSLAEAYVRVTTPTTSYASIGPLRPFTGRAPRAFLALADELGMRPLAAHCQAGLSALYRRAGNPEQAQDHLNTAIAMFRGMDMRLWLDQAETELKALE